MCGADETSPVPHPTHHCLATPSHTSGTLAVQCMQGNECPPAALICIKERLFMTNLLTFPFRWQISTDVIPGIFVKVPHCYYQMLNTGVFPCVWTKVTDAHRKKKRKRKNS